MDHVLRLLLDVLDQPRGDPARHADELVLDRLRAALRVGTAVGSEPDVGDERARAVRGLAEEAVGEVTDAAVLAVGRDNTDDLEDTGAWRPGAAPRSAPG
eukprot:10351912-Alexandrium_andersonii.AAC.1